MSNLRNGVYRIQRSLMDGLERLSRKTRVRQSEYIREAVDDFILKHHDFLVRHHGVVTFPPFEQAIPGEMVATNCLFSVSAWSKFDQLSKQTRIEKSMLFREAIYDLLAKYNGTTP